MPELHTNPVYQLETRRQISNKRLIAMRRGCLPTMLGVATMLLTPVVVLSVFSDFYSFEEQIITLLGVPFGILLLFQMIVGAVVAILTIAEASPAISGEVEVQSWGLLRATSLPLRAILHGKFMGVFARLRGPLMGLLVLRVVSGLTLIFLIMVAMLRGALYYAAPNDFNAFMGSWAWLPGLIFALVVTVFYISQPVVQFSINVALGIFYSALARSRGRALAGGLAGRLVLWVAMGMLYIGLYALFFAFIDNTVSLTVPNSFLAGLSVYQEASLLFGIGILSVVLIWAWQVGLLMVMLGWVHRRSRQLGAA